MTRSKKSGVLALCAASVILISACQEDLAGGAVCPILCPEQGLEVRDTVLFPVVLDTTLLGYPEIGTEPLLPLTARGDTLQTAVVARFDSLRRFFSNTQDTVAGKIVSIDSATLSFLVQSAPIVKDSVTFELYDVDTSSGPEADTALVRQLFRPDRLLSSVTVPKDSIVIAVRIPVPAGFITPRITSGQRVRLGLAIRSDSSALVHIVSAPSQQPPVLTYFARSAADSQAISIAANSSSLPGNASNLADFGVTLIGLPPPPPLLVVGGLPGARTYLQFDLSDSLLQQNTIVRARLELVQVPNRTIDPTDTVQVVPRMVRATNVLQAEPGKAAFLLAPVSTFPMPTVPLEPADSGLVTFQIATAVSAWRLDVPATLSSLVLQASDEAQSAHAVYFFPADASVPDSLRPRLRLSIIPRAQFGLP